MQDKIQEIMGLVKDYHEYGHQSYKDAIESKLRELVREPLSYHDISMAHPAIGAYGQLDVTERIVRWAERAHNITNTSGEV